MADTMAASSGGVEWSSVLKPFLSLHYDTSNRTEIIELCSTIIKCEAEILRHKENNKKFYDNFVVLSADYISTCTNKLPVSQIDTVSAACRVLLKYLINCLQSFSSDLNQNSAQIEIYLNAVRVLCIGTSPLSTAEVSVLVNTMKGENLPQHTNTTPPVDLGVEKDVPNKQESPKSRTDLSTDIFEQLTLPLRDGHTTTLDHSASASTNLTEVPSGSDPTSEINKLFLKTNTESLQALRAGDTLVDLCLSLQSIKKARGKVEEALAGKPFNIPTNQSEATVLKNCISSYISEIKLALSAINLPVLEPLTPSKLDKLSTLSMAVLHCAVSQAAASAVLATVAVVSPKCSAQQSQTGLKEDDFETQAVTLVEEALNMYSYIGSTIKNSTRAGGHVSGTTRGFLW
jgi:E3 ubiquitin-protein ligase UBR4